MDSIAFIAEQKILKAMEEGDLNSPRWKNKPLPLDDDHLVPEDLKIAYKLLKNSGYGSKISSPVQKMNMNVLSR